MRESFVLAVLAVMLASGCDGLSSRPDPNSNDAAGDAFGGEVVPLPDVPAVDSGGCPMGFLNCNGTCLRGLSDNANCGACGNVCADGLVCSMGRCAPTCASPFIACGGPGDGGALDGGMDAAVDGGMDGGDVPAVSPGRCIDPQFDAQNCGACGRACAMGQSCISGVCVSVQCPSNLDVCLVRVTRSSDDGGAPDGGSTVTMEPRCTDITSNLDHCGRCDAPCFPGQRCVEGMCRFACPEGTIPCDRQCVDVRYNNSRCGACNIACRSTEACIDGRCVLNCGNFARCSAIGDGGVPLQYCADVSSDPEHCGVCERRCAVGERCVSGMCQLQCAPPLTNCLGRCINIQSENNNCGGCGRSCVAGSSCVAGVCTPGCTAGQALCRPDPPDGGGDTPPPFCTTLASDPLNCGACGRVCAARQLCNRGNCETQCAMGQTQCSGVCVDLNSDPANCGACTRACPRGAVCALGRCEPRCLAPLTGCPTTAPTFCVDARYDPSNCGRCGRACATSRQCVGGTCCEPVATPDQRLAACMSGASGCEQGLVLNTGQALAQAFVPSAAGFLVRARLHASNPYAPRGTAAQVLIVPGSSGTSLASPTTDIDREAIGRGDFIGGVTADYYDVSFSPPIALTAGRTYFMVLRLTGVTTCEAPCVITSMTTPVTCECPAVRWTRVSNSTSMVDPYPAGHSFSCGAGCTLWNIDPDYRDFSFEVFLSRSCD